MSLLSSRKSTKIRIREFPGQVTTDVLKRFTLGNMNLVLWVSNWKLIGISEDVNGETSTSYLYMLNTNNTDGYNHLLDRMKTKLNKTKLLGYYDPSLQAVAKTIEQKLKETEINVEIVGDFTKSRVRCEIVVFICKTVKENAALPLSLSSPAVLNEYAALLDLVNKMETVSARSVRTLDRVVNKPVSMRRPSMDPPVRPVPKSARRPSDVELTRRPT